MMFFDISKSLLLVFLCLLSTPTVHFAENSDNVWWSVQEANSTLDGYEIIEGDILVPKNQTGRRNALFVDEYLWKDGIIPYDFGENFTPQEKNLIVSGMEFLQENTCICFVEKEREKTFLLFQKKPLGCSSTVGKTRHSTEGLPVNLQAPECFTRGIIMHELLHVVGLFHEHTRPDRDEYVDIHWSNILPGERHNFVKNDNILVTTFGLPYDYDSIMHLSKKALSVNGQPTITAKFNPNRPLGQMEKPTKEDIEKVNRMYNCKKNLF